MSSPNETVACVDCGDPTPRHTQPCNYCRSFAGMCQPPKPQTTEAADWEKACRGLQDLVKEIGTILGAQMPAQLVTEVAHDRMEELADLIRENRDLRRENDALREAAVDVTPGQPATCQLPPKDWYCTRAPGHEGPCAAHQGTRP